MTGSIEFAAAVMQANTIKIKSDSLTNGEAAASFTISITLNQPLPANAGLEITLPKANINYAVLMASIGGSIPAHSLITGLDGLDPGDPVLPYTTTISYGNYGEAARTPIPLRALTTNTGTALPNPRWRPSAVAHTDVLNIWLANALPIAAYKDVDVVFKPCTNPPSTKAIIGFAARTHDGTELEDLKFIEASVGDYQFTTDVAGVFENDPPTRETRVSIKDDKYMVSLTGLTYQFQVWPRNMIVSFSKLEVIFPVEGWKLDCSNAASLPTVTCLAVTCKFTDA